MKTALIGATGFVGSNIKKQADFDLLLGSKNIDSAYSETFDLVVSAAPNAVKWKANKFPEDDWEHVRSYMDSLGKIKAERFIAISTCDVYEHPVDCDEDTDIESTLDSLHPYGKHRYKLEKFIKENYKNSLIVRLPALFGYGLKKNVIYDFLHNNMIEAIDSRSFFQYYNLDNIWRDIEVAMNNDLELMNINSEPVSVAEVTKECFGFEFNNHLDKPTVKYDIKSKHAHLYGGSEGYLYSKEDIFKQLRNFVIKNT